MKIIPVIHSIWQYRDFIIGVVKREFKLRYVGSLLGISWNVINPLALIVVYTLVFSNIMHNRLPGTNDPLAYSIYLCAGLLPWGLFTEIISRSQLLFLENSNLLKKSNFPRLCLPIILITTSMINFVIIFGLLLIFLIITGRFPGYVAIAIFPVLTIQLMLSIGLGILTGTLNVFFRDIGNSMGIILQFWFWLTPIVYPVQILTEKIASWLALNPMVAVIGAYQDILLRQTIPDWINLFPALSLGVVLLCIAGVTFHTFSGELVDEL